MNARHARFLLVVGLCAALWWPTAAAAQEVSLTGTITDQTDAVLPGVSVTALHVASGNTFEAVTDSTGTYLFGALRVGTFTITAELPGFTRVVQENVELRVGQRPALNFKLALSSVQESVTVTGEAPLVDTFQSKLGGSVDPRIVEAMPLNGRNWLQLTMLVPGSRSNAVTMNPTEGAGARNEAGGSQLNLDGQQVTQNHSAPNFAGQPQFSREAIAEFEMITSRFDATQGRSSGVQVNAVTKSGTNVLAGAVYGYFRDDGLNAADFFAKRVLPYSDQQVGAVLGGPIVLNRAHFFGYYEFEREPQEVVMTSPYARFNIPDLAETKRQHLAGTRVDAQLNAATHFAVRWNLWRAHVPFDPAALSGGGTASTAVGNIHPTRLTSTRYRSTQVFGTLTQTLGRTMLNEVKGGYTHAGSVQDGSYLPSSVMPNIALRGYTIGRPNYMPSRQGSKVYSLRDDFSYLRGRHEMKMGAEFLGMRSYTWSPISLYGTLDATLGPVPANIEALFPVWNDPTTWNLAALSPITRSVTVGIVNDPTFGSWQPTYGAWFQDNWTATSNLTLNLGVRWDLQVDGLGQFIEFPPFRGKTDQEYTNFSPRLGFAYSLGDAKRTVVRGGFGKYFQAMSMYWTAYPLVFLRQAQVQVFNDGRPNFAADPFNLTGGRRMPTFEEAAGQPGRTVALLSDASNQTPYAYHTSVGIQQQIGNTMAIQADYVWMAGRHETYAANTNVGFNPTTGLNLPFTNAATRPFPNWATVGMRFTNSYSNYHGLETAFTKRFSDHWQGSVTYTLSSFKDYRPTPTGVGGVPLVAVPVPEDLGGDYTHAPSDQRHRAVFNGMWELPYGVQVSGLYFFGSGSHFPTVYGADLRNSGGLSFALRPDGTAVKRNSFVGKPLHRVDLRAQKRFQIGRVQVDGIAELFNVFNHENYGGYVTAQASPLYGRPVPVVGNTAYYPRMGQLGVRVAF